jgi:hypothetical protein
MSTLIHTTPEMTNAYVQTVFRWESSPHCDSLVTDAPDVLPCRSKTPIKQNAKAMAHATPVENVRQRRVGCEHVGSALATVLGGYGISIDALISEIERLKSAS